MTLSIQINICQKSIALYILASSKPLRVVNGFGCKYVFDRYREQLTRDQFVNLEDVLDIVSFLVGLIVFEIPIFHLGENKERFVLLSLKLQL